MKIEVLFKDGSHLVKDYSTLILVFGYKFDIPEQLLIYCPNESKNGVLVNIPNIKNIVLTNIGDSLTPPTTVINNEGDVKIVSDK